MTKIYDISPPISPQLGVFPGDTPFRREVALSIEDGDNLTLSAIHTTLHLGAHTDAPSHYDAKGAGIAQRPLSLYLGRAQVMHCPMARGTRVRPADLPDPIQAPRVLLRTDSFPDPDAWNGDFAALSPELVDHLAAAGVRLIGIDTPSVDPQDDAELHSHHAIVRHDMAILEGIVLSDVPPGIYALIALPLPIVGADASPVRAVLLPAASSDLFAADGLGNDAIRD